MGQVLYNYPGMLGTSSEMMGQASAQHSALPGRARPA